MRHCYIVFLCFLPHKPHFHALGPIVLRVSAIYEYGVFLIPKTPNRASKINVRISHGAFQMKYCTVICITSQKYKVEQLPILWNMENQSRQNFCLASHCSWCPSVIQLESCRSTITIENLLHCLKYFDENKIYMKYFLWGFVKFPSTHLFSGFFCTNAERFEWEKIVQVLSAILNLVTWPGSFPDLLNNKCYRRRENGSRSIVLQ